MTLALSLPSFKNIAAGLAGLFLAMGLFFAAAPQARAADLTEEQVSAVLDLLYAFGVDQQTLINVEGMLRASSAASGDSWSGSTSNTGSNGTDGVYFSALPHNGQAPLTVEFVTSVSGGDANYFVDFGDKGIGWFEKGLMHTYASPGTYVAGMYRCNSHVSAKVCGDSTFLASKTVTVTSPGSSYAPPSGVAVSAPHCPPLLAGQHSAASHNGSGSCTVTSVMPVAEVPPAVPRPPLAPLWPHTGVPDVAGLMAAAATAPWFAAVDSLSNILFAAGIY